MLEDLFGLKASVIIAAFLGGVSAAFLMRDLTPLRAVAAVFVGCFTGAYLAPLGTYYLVSQSMVEAGGPAMNAAAYIVGVSGMAVCNGIIEAASRIISKKTGGGGQ